jgi:SAM-dependent methyltransferase
VGLTDLLKRTAASRNAAHRAGATLERLGLAGPAFRVYERLITPRDDGPSVDADGLAIPPARLRVKVIGDPDLDVFLRSGSATAATIRSTVEKSGLDFGRAGAILDFGVGCGRVSRHWRAIEGPSFHGTDYNPELVRWCADNLGFLKVERNEPQPPMRYPDDSFDVIYAISVLTHLPVTMQVAWMGEFARVLRPGGRLLVTVHGRATIPHMLAGEREQFERGEAVVRYGNAPGSNLCVTYHPRSWFEANLTAGLDLLTVIEGGAPGLGSHDIYVLTVGS